MPISRFNFQPAAPRLPSEEETRKLLEALSQAPQPTPPPAPPERGSLPVRTAKTIYGGTASALGSILEGGAKVGGMLGIDDGTSDAARAIEGHVAGLDTLDPGFGHDVASGLGSIAPYVAAGLFGGIPGIAAGMGVGTLQHFDEATERAVRQGMTPEEAATPGRLGAAALLGAGEMVPIERAISRAIQIGKGPVVNILTKTAADAAEEAIQEGVSEGAHQLLAGEDGSFGDIAYNAAVGSAVGGIFGGGMNVAGAIRGQREQGPLDTVTEPKRQQAIEAGTEGAPPEAAPVIEQAVDAETSNEAVAKQIEQASKDGDPSESIAETVAQTPSGEAALASDELAGIRDAIAQAEASEEAAGAAMPVGTGPAATPTAATTSPAQPSPGGPEPAPESTVAASAAVTGDPSGSVPPTPAQASASQDIADYLDHAAKAQTPEAAQENAETAQGKLEEAVGTAPETLTTDVPGGGNATQPRATLPEPPDPETQGELADRQNRESTPDSETDAKLEATFGDTTGSGDEASGAATAGEGQVEPPLGEEGPRPDEGEPQAAAQAGTDDPGQEGVGDDGGRTAEPTQHQAGGESDQAASQRGSAQPPGEIPSAGTGRDDVSGPRTGAVGDQAASDELPRNTPAGAPRVNYHYGTSEGIGQGQRPTSNLTNLAKALEAFIAVKKDGRNPTPEELNALAGYGGVGNPNVETELFRNKNPSGLAKRVRELMEEAGNLIQEGGGSALVEQIERPGRLNRAALAEEQRRGVSETAMQARINQHFTSLEAAESMWKAAQTLPNNTGRWVEPGAGIGVFAGTLPQEMSGVTLTMLERDIMPHEISKILYPQHVATRMDLESWSDQGVYDGAIGNVPFGRKGKFPLRFNNREHAIHNGTILKALDSLKQGGWAFLITSTGTLDSQNTAHRREMEAMADLVAAVRLPSNAFQRDAKTSVVTDVLVFRKRFDGEPRMSVPDWQAVQQKRFDGARKKDKAVSRSVVYNADNPIGLVLGQERQGRGMYGDGQYMVTYHGTTDNLTDHMERHIRSRIETLRNHYPDIINAKPKSDSQIRASQRAEEVKQGKEDGRASDETLAAIGSIVPMQDDGMLDLSELGLDIDVDFAEVTDVKPDEKC